MPLPLIVSCFSKIQIGFSFLVPAHPGSPGQRAVQRVCVCVCVLQAETRQHQNVQCYTFLLVSELYRETLVKTVDFYQTHLHLATQLRL